MIAGAKASSKIRIGFEVSVGPRSRFRKPKVAEIIILTIFLSFAIALLGVKNLSSLLKAT